MKIKAFCAIAAPVFALGAPAFSPTLVHVRAALLGPSFAAPALAVQAAPGAPQSPAIPNGARETVELHTAVERRIVKAEFRGNGRDVFQAKLTNTSSTPVEVQAESGQMFEAGSNTMIVVRPAAIQVEPGQTVSLALSTVAPRSGNKLTEQSYRLSYGRLPKLARLFTYAREHPELSPAAVQSAVLALTENLPLSAVCKFTPIASELRSRFNTDAFRVETLDLLAALTALRELGVPDSSLVLTIDPQLKVEAMIEPASRAAAMRYYGITAQNEWEFWRRELLQGEPGTRHYALYGIARFYPEIAIDMLPKWARETKTNAVFRLTALQALAATQLPEALPVLRQLADELGLGTELGRAAAGAAEFLGQHLATNSVKQASLTFRTDGDIARF